MAKIIKNKMVLFPSYLPDDIVMRQWELQEIWFNLQDLTGSSPAPPYPMHLFGPRGTGKTVVTQFLLKRLSKEIDPEKVIVLYTPTQPSSFSTLCSLLTKLVEKPMAVRNSFYDYWAEFESRVKGKFLLVVLDDIDKLTSNKRDNLDLLFNLSRMENATIISISNKGWALDRLQDPKYSSIESSFKPAKVIFKPYTANELFQILKARQPLAFYPNTCPDEVLLECAKIASYSGDARWALDLLLSAAQIAQMRGADKIKIEDVKVADKIVEQMQLRSKLSGLTRPELVYLKAAVLATNVEPRTGIRHEPLIAEVDNKFTQIAPTHGINIYSQVRLRQLREHLVAEQFIRVYGGKGLGRGKGTEWRISILHEDLEALYTELNIELGRVEYEPTV
jgi:cell division control protein 6